MVFIEIEFDERDPLYKCCCGIFHVKTGTRVLSVLNIMISSFTAFQIFLVPYNWVWSTIQFCESLTNIFSSALMFIATFTFRPKLVIAYLATQLTILICCVLLFATLMLSIVLPQSVGRFIAENLFEMSFLEDELSGLNEDEARSVIIFLCFCFACFIFGSMMWEIFLLRVSFQCYNYLLDVRDARNGTNRLPPLRLESNTRGVFLVGRVIPHMIRIARHFPLKMVVVQFDFDERDPLYRCCFELLHIRRGAQILAVFNATLGILMFSAFFFWDFDVLFAIIQVAQGAIQAISAVLMLIAVKLVKSRLVIPYLAAQLLMLFTTALFFVIFIITVYFPDAVGNFIFEILKISKEQVDKIEEDWGHDGYIFILRLGGFSMSVLCFFLFCFELWTLRVSFQCYNYLLDASEAREGTNRLPPLRMERNGEEEITIIGFERIHAVYNPVTMSSTT